jgi:hypothetical protein
MIKHCSWAFAEHSGDSAAFFSSLVKFLSGGLGLIGLLLTLFCLIHAFSTKQSWWWSLALLLLPPFGALLYLFMVVFRGTDGDESAQFTQAGRVHSALHQRIKELEAQLAESDTIALKTELGQCWLQMQDFDQAENYFASCLVGNFQNDPLLLYQLALALYGKDENQKALEALQKTFREDYQDKLSERLFLQAKILAELERAAEALEIYARIAQHFSSPEFYCRQGLLHDQLGEAEKADAFYLMTLRQKNKLSAEELKEARPWLAKAAKNVRNM